MLEIEDQAFIIGIGLDAVEGSDEMTVTFQIAQPKAFTAESQAEEPFWNIIEKAKDLTQARDHLLRSNSCVPTMEHCQVILIGEDLARKGLKDFLDFIVQNGISNTLFSSNFVIDFCILPIACTNSNNYSGSFNNSSSFA
jgi:hypothetical protein